VENVDAAHFGELEPAPRVARADLDRSLLSGIAWTSIVTWFSQALGWSTTLVVVHYLAPSDYGLIGMAALYLGLVQMASELGLGSAVVRFHDLTSNQLGQFNSLSVIAGAAGVALSLAAAIPMGYFFREPRLPAIVAVMSLAFFISGFKIVPQALLQRQLQFRKLALIEGTQSIVGALSNLTMVLLGFGYWTLAIYPVVCATVYAMLVVLNCPTHFRRPRLSSIRQPFAFSSHMLFTRFAWYAYSNADFAVIGKLLGKAALGAYTVGWTMSGMAVEKITSLIGRVTPAFFATVQHDIAELRRYLLLLTEALALLTFPVCVGIALIAGDIVRLALGERWTVAIVPLQLLAIMATFRSIEPLIPQVLAAIGETRLNVRNALLTVVVLPAGFLFATRWGIVGVASAWLVLGPLMFSPLLAVALRRIELPARDYFRSLWPATSGCLIMALVVISVDRAFLKDTPLYVSLLTKIVAGAAAYAGSVFTFQRDRIQLLRELWRLLRSPRPSALPDVAVATVIGAADAVGAA